MESRQRSRGRCPPTETGAHLRVVEDAAAVVGAYHSVLPILAKVCCRDQLGLPVHFVPQSHFFVRNVPESKLPVQRAAQKISVILKRREGTMEMANEKLLPAVAFQILPHQ